jgi:hypothetical protein
MVMSNQLFNKILKDAEEIPNPFIIAPFKLGEPLLDPYFARRLLQIDAQLPNAIFEIHTNLNYLPKDLIAALRRIHRVNHIWVSLNQYTDGAYKETTGMSFKKTLLNINRLLDANIPHKIVVGRVATYSDEDNIWMDWVKQTFPTATPALIVRGDWCDNVTFPLKHNPRGPCKRTHELSICCDGRVALCCMDGLCEYCLGDITKQSLLEIYNGPKSKSMRSMTKRTQKPCATCTFV